jgi:predicted dehydrogenase
MHVLCEKPAGVYTRQVREMNRAAEDSGKVFAMMFNVRTRPEYRKLHDLVDSGELGELKRAVWIITDWYRTQSYYDSGDWRATWAGEGGGVLLNQCPHQLDLWQWITGLPVRVRAFCHFGRYHDIEVEDDVTAYVEYDNGATGLFVATTGEAPGTNRLELTGERGKIVLEEGKIRFWRTRQPVSEHCRTEPKGFKKPETWVCDIPTGRTPDGHVKIMQNVTDTILGKDKLLAPGLEGIRSLELSNAMLLSAWTDDWAAIPVDEDRFDAELQKRIDSSEAKTTVRKQAMDLSDSFSS